MNIHYKIKFFKWLRDQCLALRKIKNATLLLKPAAFVDIN